MAAPPFPPSAFASDRCPRSNPSRSSPNPDLTMALLKAALDGDLRLLEKLARVLDEGEGRVAEKLGAVRDVYGISVLHSATLGGSLPMCRYLVEDLRLDVDSFGPGDETPLAIAIGRGSVDLVRYFLDQGADTERLNIDGCTPLHLAASEGMLEVVELLLSKGANVDALNLGWTALHGAAHNGRDEIVKILLDHHADHNIALSGTGYTALNFATIAGSLKCVKLLLEASADVNGIGKDTPLIIAARAGFTDILKCLVQAGADPNVRDSLGRAPIEIAALCGRREDVDILFPVTSHISSVPDWSVDGIISYLKSEPLSEQPVLASANAEAHEAFKNGNYLTAAKSHPEPILASAKAEAHEAFKNGNYLTAAKIYAEAIDLDPDNATLFSNRSLCWLRLGDAENALMDAQVCRMMRPDWSNACYLEGAALMLLKDYEKACGAFHDGLQLEPGNVDIESGLREALESLKTSRSRPGKDKAN